jgi:hypothetical protein
MASNGDDNMTEREKMDAHLKKAAGRNIVLAIGLLLFMGLMFVVTLAKLDVI